MTRRGKETRTVTIYMTPTELAELKREAYRLDCNPSQVMQMAWKEAKAEVSSMRGLSCPTCEAYHAQRGTPCKEK